MGDAPSRAVVLRVLIVDDNRDVADSAAIMLRMWGYDVRVANCGQDAIGIVASWLPDVALLDLAMPGMDGLSLARRLRSVDGLHELTLIAVTGVIGKAAQAQAEAEGFTRYMLKPCSPSALREALDEIAPAQQPDAEHYAAGYGQQFAETSPTN
jgi:CheY-like chemotaxis protein